MPTFKPYPKIHRLGKDETMSLAGSILDGTVYVQEKLDGANASIWMDDNEKIRCGSRTQDVTEKPFNGFPEYVMGHDGINAYLRASPSHRLYGEWLVRHTVGYDETSYRKFYLFDIELPSGENMEIQTMYMEAETYGIETAHFVGKFENPTPEQVEEYCGKSRYGQKGEGVVIKNPEFRNKFGDPCHAKIVTQEFKENNGITFGGNNKESDTYEEMYVCNKYIGLERVRKIVQKLESAEWRKLELRDIPKVSSSAYHDMLVEEIWEISERKKPIDFSKLKSLCSKKATFIFKNLFEESISVAFSNLR